MHLLPLATLNALSPSDLTSYLPCFASRNQSATGRNFSASRSLFRTSCRLLFHTIHTIPYLELVTKHLSTCFSHASLSLSFYSYSRRISVVDNNNNNNNNNGHEENVPSPALAAGIRLCQSESCGIPVDTQADPDAVLCVPCQLLENAAI